MAAVRAPGAAVPGALCATLTPRGLLVSEAALLRKLGGRAKLKKIEEMFTVREHPQPGRPSAFGLKVVTAFTRSGDTLCFPHAAAPLFVKHRVLTGFETRLREPTAAPLRALDPQACEPATPLYPYQTAAVKYICDVLGRAPPAATYIKMGTGLGKTRVGCAVAAAVGNPVLVVVPTKHIRGQWVDEFNEFLPGLRVAVYDNSMLKLKRGAPGPQTHDVIIAIVNTVAKKEPKFYEDFGLVVLDEAHEYSSPTGLAVLRLACATKVLGLTATPFDRRDCLDRIVPVFLGKPKSVENIPGFDPGEVTFTGRVREIEYFGHPDHTEKAVSATGTVSAIGTIGNITEDPCRLRLISNEVKRLLELHTQPDAADWGLGPRPAAAATERHPAGEVRTHSVLVFAELRRYLPKIRDALQEAMPGVGIDVPELADDSDEDEYTEYGGELGGELDGGLDGADDGAEDGADDGADDCELDDAPDGADDGELDGADDDAPDGADDGEPDGADDDAGPFTAILQGGATRDDIKGAERCRVAVTTFGYSRRGVSLQHMTALVWATPRRGGACQIIGRVTRRGSDQSIVRVIVDIKDMRTPLRSQSTDRRREYKARGFPVEKFKASYTQYEGVEGPVSLAVADAAEAAPEKTEDDIREDLDAMLAALAKNLRGARE